MNFFRKYSESDDVPPEQGDSGFVGVDMQRDPGQLEAGLGTVGVNVRFTDFVVAPRRGARLMSWASRLVGGAGPGEIHPYGPVAGSGVFQDPITGLAWLIVAVVGGGVYRSRPGNTAALMSMPVGEVIPARVQLIQTFNGLVMLRGYPFENLVCDDLDVGFKALPAAANAPGNVPIPPSSRGIYFQNRLFCIDGRPDATHVDTVFVSDFGAVHDVLEGSISYNSFKINKGSSDRLVTVYRFNDLTLIAAKDASIYVVSNISGTNEELAVNAKLDTVTTEYGCIAPGSFVQVGSDVWFLAHRRGISSIRQTEQNKLQGVDIPVSLAIDPLIQRINWEHSAGAVAASHDNKVYFAVPLDASTVNNAVLVYDTFTGKWSGHDEGPAIRVAEWVKFQYGGAMRLLFVSHDGFVSLYEDGFFDQVGQAESGIVLLASIQHQFRTRGYGGAIPGRKRFGIARSRLSTWWSTYTVGLQVDGVAETRALNGAGTTYSQTRYRKPHTKAPWVATNINDDHLTPHREDYAIVIGEGGLLPGAIGINPDLHQTTDKGWRLRCHGRYVQLDFAGIRGRAVLRSLEVEMFRGSPRDGPQT